MVRPWEVVYAVVDLGIRVAGAFGSELPYCPVGAVFAIEEGDET